MINVKIFVDSHDEYTGFSVSGHSGYAEIGSDIICAGVSALTSTAVNSIESFTNDSVSYEAASGKMDVRFTDSISKESHLLIDSMILGLQGITESYGDKYLKISYKEV